jgi:hypothetical protein
MAKKKSEPTLTATERAIRDREQRTREARLPKVETKEPETE